MTLTEAKRIAGSLGYPSKMPGTSYGLPAQACITGAKLAKVEGSVCSRCYALPGAQTKYRMPNAQRGMYRRLAAITDPRWVDAMVKLLTHVHSKPRIRVDLGIAGRRAGDRFRWNDTGYHRWHDSGDLQSVGHLEAICLVAMRTPQIKHWLPTQELGMVRRYAARGIIPTNLTIRVSSVMIDDWRRRDWPNTSSVFMPPAPINCHVCPAPLQGHRCGDCRACWSRDVAHVAYECH